MHFDKQTSPFNDKGIVFHELDIMQYSQMSSI